MPLAPADDLKILLTTVGSAEQAESLARALVNERLAACVNALPVAFSVYRWKDQVETEPEYLLIVKTARDRVAALAERLRALHPYETPELVELAPLAAASGYLRWVFEETRPDRRA